MLKKRPYDIAARIFGFLVTLIGTAALAIQMPVVQTGLAEKALGIMEDMFSGTMSVGTITIEPFNSFKITDVLVLDDAPYDKKAPADTFFYAKSVSGRISFASILSGNGVYLSRAKVEGGYLHLVIEPDANNLTGAITNLEKIFRLKDKPVNDKAATSNIFHIGRAKVTDFRYKMTNCVMQQGYIPPCINWADLDLSANIRVHNLKYTGGRMSGVVDEFNATEKSGYRLTSLTGRARVGMGKAIIERVHFVDEWSDIRIPLYSMSWKSVTSDFADFLNKIRLEASISGGRISAKTLRAFIPIPQMDLTLEMGKTNARGYISDMDIQRLRFKDPDSGIIADISGTVTGLPDVRGLLLNTRVNNINFSTRGIGRLLRSIGIKDVNLNSLAPGRNFSFSGTAKGPINRLNTDGHLASRIGRASFNLGIRNLADKRRRMEVRGTVNTRNLDAGQILGIARLGEVTVGAGFRATFGKSAHSVILDSLIVDKLGVLGYDYTGIAAAGKYDGTLFDGRVISGDPNLNFIMQGIFNIIPGTRTENYKFKANIGYADLHAIKLDKRPVSKVTASLSADFIRNKGKDLVGDIAVRDLILENGNGVKDIGDITLDARNVHGINYIQLASKFLDAGYAGNGAFDQIVADIQSITTRRELKSLYRRQDEDKGNGEHSYELSMDFHDSRDLLSFVIPGLYIADSTKIDIKDKQGKLTGKIRSSRLAWRTNYLKDLDISLDNLGGSLNADLMSSEVNFGGLGLKSSALTAYARQDSLFLSFHYDGLNGIDNVGELYLTGDLSRDETDTLSIHARPLASYLRFGSNQWDFDESDFVFRAGDASVKGFRIHNGDQRISLGGGISRNKADSLVLSLENIDLSMINYFTAENYDIHGRTGGSALLTSPLSGNVRALANILCDSLKVGGMDNGTIRAAAIWDSNQDNANLYISNTLNGKDALSASGTIKPRARTMDVTAKMEELSLIIARPFLSKYVSNMSGGISGELSAKGSLDSLMLSSKNARIDKARGTVAVTGVNYTIDGPFHVDNTGLHFDDISIMDDKSGSAVLSGGIDIRNLNRIMFDASLRLHALEMFNVTGGHGPHGSIFANGSAHVSGPPQAIFLEADVSTAGAGLIQIPLGGAASATKSDLLTFRNHQPVYIDPYEEMLASLLLREEIEELKGKGNFQARVRLVTDPELEAILELDENGDNQLHFRGNGAIGVTLQPSKDKFDITGDYSIAGGKYHFSMPGIIDKDFSIDNGSTITFGGNIMDTRLDIGATYTLRTSLNRLLADTSSVATRRPVDCGIHISDRLSSPHIDFSVNVPDLDPSTKAAVESALNTEDKVQKQFMALLVTGSFIPIEESGVVNNPNILYSNVSEIMSGQFSSILSKLDIPLNMGVGYQQDSRGSNMFDVDLSTNLFDNRVEVRGSVSNRQRNRTASRNSEVVGNLDIDWKINNNGNLRLNFFSHSADEYTSFLDYSQRNGAGVTYQNEFNTWADFFRNIFSNRKKREQKAAESAAANRQRVTTTLNE